MNLSWMVDDCLARLASGESIEACLARHPEHAGELAPLLAAAVQVRVLSQAQLTQGQRLRAKVTLREALAEGKRPRAPMMRSWMRALPAAMILAAVLSVGVTGAAVAGSRPGDLAYPLRVVVERAPILIQFSSAGRAAKEVSVAGRRLSDVRQYLLRAGAAHPVALDELLARDEAAVQRAARLAPEDRQAILDEITGHAYELTELAGMASDAETQARLQAVAERILGMTTRPVLTPVVVVEAPRATPSPVSLVATIPPSFTPTQAVTPSPTSTPRPYRPPVVPPTVTVTPSVQPTIGVPTVTLSVVVPEMTPPAPPTIQVDVTPRPSHTPRPNHTPKVPGSQWTPIATWPVPTVVEPTIVIPTIKVPTIRIPTRVMPATVVPEVTAEPTPAPTVTSHVSGVPTGTATPAATHTPTPIVVPPTVLVPSITLPPPVQTMIVMTVVPPPPVQTMIVMTILPPPPVQTLIVMTILPPTLAVPTVVVPALTHTPGAALTAVATAQPPETHTPRPRNRP